MKENATFRIAIYSRKSKYTGKGESIENQIELCKQYIRTHYPDCNEDGYSVYEDEGFSGGNTERPQFKKMMADAKTHHYHAIICYRLDRISRNIGDFAKLIEELDGLHIAFVSIKEQFDTSSPMGRAMMYISSVFSQLERETIAERIRDNMHELSKTGRWLGGTTPTGYVSESVEHVSLDGKIKKACKLKLVPEEAAMVRLIFKTFLTTQSLTKTETNLIQNGYQTKNGRQITRFGIKNILTNPVYMIADSDAYRYFSDNKADLFAEASDFDGKYGVMAYNRTLQKSGKTNQIRPISEWIVSIGKHPGLIEGRDWVRTQEYLVQNRAKAYRKPRSNTALLSGLLFCGHCGGYMRPKLSKQVDAQGAFRYTYLCAMKEKSRSHCCQVKNASGNALDKAVYVEIKKLGEDGATFIQQLALGKKKLANSPPPHHECLERWRATLTEQEQEIAAYVTSLAKASGTSAEDYIVAQIDRLHINVEMVRNRIATLENITANRELSKDEFDMLCQRLSSTKDMLDDMSVTCKREAVRTLVKKVVWDGEHAHLYFFDLSGNLCISSDENPLKPVFSPPLV